MIHPLETEIIPQAHAAFAVESGRVIWTNLVLAGYLLTDLLHIIAKYPQLGKLDIVMHHVAFLACAISAGYYGLHPFAFAWLIIGEASTPFLNARWFLIKAGKGSTKYFRVIQALFGLIFIVTRLFIYSIGTCYHMLTIKYIPSRVPNTIVAFSASCIVAGFILNMTWLRKMYMMLTGRGKRTRRSQSHDSDSGEQTTSPSTTAPDTDAHSEAIDSVQTESTSSQVATKSE
ncbi:hypothetical protein FGB62_93g055 [Gracilaria domingensis]|nr:hypothetical protein FGB62_93g055 [Gracilaria domingensis]